MSPRQQHYWRGLHVPFIAPWSNEKMRPYTIVRVRGQGGEGIGYQDEDSTVDRRLGALWLRMSAARGVGEPRLASVHALRQRQAMANMLCQVCGDFAIRDDERHLFVMRDRDGQPIGEGERTHMPPIHDTCASEAVRDCPHLRKGWVAALVEYAPAWGVAGIVHDPTTLRPLPPKDGEDELTYVGHDNRAIRWTLATREVVTLHGCTAVDLAELAVAA